jgi:hypothetical protein
MLLDAVATIILAGMMLIPIVNVFVGVVVGAHLGGVPLAAVGAFIAVAIIRAEAHLFERFEWLQLAAEPLPASASEETAVPTVGRHASRMVRPETPRARPPRPRPRTHRLRHLRERTRHAAHAREQRSGMLH